MKKRKMLFPESRLTSYVIPDQHDTRNVAKPNCARREYNEYDDGLEGEESVEWKTGELGESK